MDRVEKDHRVSGGDETRHPLRAAFDELDHLGVDRCARFIECRRGRIDADHFRIARVTEALENELSDRTRAAPQVDDLASPGADHALHNPPIDLGEERMAREGLEREPAVVNHLVNRHPTPSGEPERANLSRYNAGAGLARFGGYNGNLSDLTKPRQSSPSVVS